MCISETSSLYFTLRFTMYLYVQPGDSIFGNKSTTCQEYTYSWQVNIPGSACKHNSQMIATARRSRYVYAWQPSSWIFYFCRLGTRFILAPSTRSSSKTYAWPLKSCCVYKLRYVHFWVGGHQLGFL